MNQESLMRRLLARRADILTQLSGTAMRPGYFFDGLPNPVGGQFLDQIADVTICIVRTFQSKLLRQRLALNQPTNRKLAAKRTWSCVLVRYKVSA